MNSFIFKLITICILFFSFLSSCVTSKIKRIEKSKLQEDNVCSYKINKKGISPLKKEWPILYQYLAKGHLVRCKVDSSTSRLMISNGLYLHLQRNERRIYNSPYLQDYNNFVAVFGEPYSKVEKGELFYIVYIPKIFAISNLSVNSGLTYYFDSETMQLSTGQD